MQPRHPGCETFFGETEYGIPGVPVCMGGAAIRGAAETIVGCNKPQECLTVIREAGSVNRVTYEDDTKSRIVRVVQIRRIAPETISEV